MPHDAFPPHSTPLPHARRRVRALCTTVALLAATSSSLFAQAGTVTFDGASNGVTPTLAFGGGPTLDFSSRILNGFGDQSVVNGEARWWTGSYSGQGMVYGSNTQQGTVLELRLEAVSGFDLMLERALFGGYLNAQRYVSFQLFSDDYTQSTSLETVLTGSATPALGLFATNGWGNAIRLQFTETDAGGTVAGRGAFDVGIQDIGYIAGGSTPPTGVPEPSGVALMAAGLVGLGIATRRQRLNA